MPQRKNYIMSNISIILGYILIYAVSLYNIQYINIAVSVAVNFFLIYLCLPIYALKSMDYQENHWE